MDVTETVLAAALSAALGGVVAGLSVVSGYGTRITALETKVDMWAARLERIENKLDRVLEDR
jgi:hypothetical protein